MTDETETNNLTDRRAALDALKTATEHLSTQTSSSLERAIDKELIDQRDAVKIDYAAQAAIMSAGLVGFGLITGASLIAGAIDRSTGKGGNQ